MSSPDPATHTLPEVLARLARRPAPRAADEARADQDRRWRAGECPPAEAYLAGLPAVAADPEQALVLIYGEVLARTGRGERPTLAEYRERFPHLADRLATQFAVHDALAAAPATGAIPPGPRPADGPTPGADAAESDPGGASADVQQTVSAFGPPGDAAEVGRLAHYRVLRLLGEGGMGMVFLAEDTRLERPVALKVMRPSVAKHPAAHGRFLREARAAAAVRHDHVVTIYQVDEYDGAPFLAMELLDGLPLDRWLAAHPAPPLKEVVRIAREAAEGLAAAHARGLIHRDVKPANLWVEAPTGRVKILDFGLARPARDDTRVSGAGAVVGTPAYMAPEQARGEDVDHRADLFSLGVVLYRMATGRAPFTGNSVMAVLTSLAVDAPVPVAALNPTAPPALAGLIDQLLAKDPAGRPGSAAAVAEALRRVESALEFEALPRAVPVELPQAPDPWRDIELTEADPSYAAVPEAAPVPGDVPEVAPFPRPVAPRNPSRPIGWKIPVVWGLLGLVTLGFGIGMFLKFRPGPQPAPDDTAKTDTGGDKDDGKGKKPPPGKEQPPPLMPEVELAPLEYGPGPLDKLDAKMIPAKERFGWQPKGLVAVVGTHDRRHWGQVTCLAHSPDSKLLVTGGADRVLRVWDARTLEAKFVSPPHEHPVTGIVFAPDGSFCVSMAHATFHVWDVRGEKLALRYAQGTPTQGLLGNVSPDGKQLVVADGGHHDLAFRVWDLTDAKAKPRVVPTGHKLVVASALFVRGGKEIATLGNDGQIKFWDTTAGKSLRVIDLPRKNEPNGPHNLTTSADGNALALGVVNTSGPADVMVWNLADGEPKPVYAGQFPGQFAKVTLSADGMTLLAMSSDSHRVYRLGGKSEPLTLPSSCTYGTLSPDGKLVALEQFDLIHNWDVSGAEPKRLSPDGPRTVAIAAFLNNGERLLTLREGTDSPVLSLDRPAPEQTHRFANADQPVHWASGFQVQVDRLLTHITSGQIRLWDTSATPEKVVATTAIGFPNNPLRALAPDRQTFATLERTGEIKLWRVDGGTFRELAALEPRPGASQAHDQHNVQFSGDGQRLLAQLDRAVLYDLSGPKAKEITLPPVAADDGYSKTALSRDGRRFAAVGAKKVLRVWEQIGAKWELFAEIPTPHPPGVSLRFAPDGHSVLGASRDGYAAVWDVASGKPTWEATLPYAVEAEYAPDGRHLLTINQNGTVYIVRLARRLDFSGPSPYDALDAKAIPAKERFEWQPKELVAVVGSHARKHWGPIHHVAYSPDGKIVATAGADGFVHLYDADTLAERAAFEAYPHPVHSLAFSPDGRTLATCSQAENTGTKLWNLADVQPKLIHAVATGGVAHPAFSPDGTRLAVRFGTDIIRLIDLSAREPVVVKEVKTPHGQIYSHAFVRGGKQFATAGSDGTVRFWDAATGEPVGAPLKHDGTVTLTVTKDGLTLVTADASAQFRVWDLSAAEPELKGTHPPPKKTKPNPAVWVSVTPDGKRLLSTENDTYHVWDLNAGEAKLVTSFTPFTGGGAQGFAIATDRRSVAIGWHGRLRLWDIAKPTPEEQFPFTEANYSTTPLAVTPGGRLLVGRATDYAWYDLSGVAPRFDRPEPKVGVVSQGQIQISRNGRFLYTGHSAGEPLLNQFAVGPAGAEVVRSMRQPGHTLGIGVCADGVTVARCDNSPAIRVWRPKGKEWVEVAKLDGLPPQFQARFTHDARTLITGGPTLWDLTASPPVKRKLPPDFLQGAWEVSSDGQWLATWDGVTIRVWDLTGRELRRVGVGAAVRLDSHHRITFSPDGRHLLAGGMKGVRVGKLYLYEVSTSRLRREWTFPNVLADMQFTPDGRHVVTANPNGTAYVLRLAPPRAPGADPLAAVFRPADPAWEKKLLALPADEQGAELTAEFQRRNPGYKGEVTTTLNDGAVVEVKFAVEKADDVTPLRVLPKLATINGKPAAEVLDALPKAP